MYGDLLLREYFVKVSYYLIILKILPNVTNSCGYVGGFFVCLFLFLGFF